MYENKSVCLLDNKYQYSSGRVDGILLGDSGYPAKRFLLTPFMNPAEPHQVRYNNAHARTRVVVEQTIGILKRRFGILGDKMQLVPLKACKVVVACSVLHDIGIEEGDIIPVHDELDFLPDDHMEQDLLNEQGDGQHLREFIARTCFM